MNWEGEDTRGEGGGKEEWRKRGQVLEQRSRVRFVKLPKKILESLRVPAQDGEYAGRMTHVATMPRSVSGCKPLTNK